MTDRGIRLPGDTEEHLLFNGLYESECPVCSKIVNHVTPLPPPIADTSLNGAHGAPPTEDTKMFRNDTFDYVVLATLALSLLLTVVVR